MAKKKSKYIAKLQTDGSGYWSKYVADVPITGFMVYQTIATGDIPSENHAETWGELRVYFDTKYWDTDTHGLIYTDKYFQELLRIQLAGYGFSDAAVRDVGYSEQGMQGDNYVSFDLGETFLKELDPLVNFTRGKALKIDIPVEKDYITWD